MKSKLFRFLTENHTGNRFCPYCKKSNKGKKVCWVKVKPKAIKLLLFFTLLCLGLMGCEEKGNDISRINPIAVFKLEGTYRGMVYEYEGKKYIFNYEGGILEIKLEERKKL